MTPYRSASGLCMDLSADSGWHILKTVFSMVFVGGAFLRQPPFQDMFPNFHQDRGAFSHPSREEKAAKETPLQRVWNFCSPYRAAGVQGEWQRAIQMH